MIAIFTIIGAQWLGKDPTKTSGIPRDIIYRASNGGSQRPFTWSNYRLNKRLFLIITSVTRPCDHHLLFGGSASPGVRRGCAGNKWTIIRAAVHPPTIGRVKTLYGAPVDLLLCRSVRWSAHLITHGRRCWEKQPRLFWDGQCDLIKRSLAVFIRI